MHIKAITFDLDNTLWHVDDAIRVAEQNTFSYLTTHCPEVAQHHSIHSLRQLMHKLLQLQPELNHQISQLRKMALMKVIVQSGYSGIMAQQVAEEAFAIFLQGRHQVTLFNHALDILNLLNQDYQLGVLTNGNADIRRLPVHPYFDFAFSAEECMSRKPESPLFQAALEFTGLSPSECIHVGDHHEQDIFGAQQMGFYTVWINIDHRKWPGGTRATAEINCLSQLPNAIAAIERIALDNVS
ncbi:MAG: HAD family hydrolase [Pseudomonadales bacterium]|nr:HAD family hydrolase [Pseudomonadales bacterium]